MWFLSRYIGLIVDVAILVYLTFVAAEHFDVWTPGLYIYDAILALQLFNTLYQFDMRLFVTQSGPWSSDEELIA